MGTYPEPDDPFIAEVLYVLPPEAMRQLSWEQQQQVKESLRPGAPRSRHRIDWRLTIPFFFTQFYVVFQVGKDRRKEVTKVMNERRRSAKGFFTSVGVLIGAIVVFVVGFVGLYVVKSATGINIFKKDHLQDYVPFAPLSKK